MKPRTLRWPTASALARCAEQLGSACTAWAEAWTGQALPVEVLPGAASGTRQRSLALASGERVALAGADLTALFSSGPTDPSAALTRAACAAAEADLLERLFAAVVSPLAPGEVPQPDLPAGAPDLPYTGTTHFNLWVGGHTRIHVQVSGDALARLALPVAAAVKPQAMDPAAVRRLAEHSTVRACLKLSDLTVPLGALLQAEIGDVIVLDRKLDAPFEWEVAALGLRLPAQLVRSGEHLAAELL